MDPDTRMYLRLSIITALLSLPFQSILAAPSLSFGAVTASPGEKIYVPAYLIDGGTPAAIQFDIHYENAQLTSGAPEVGAKLHAHSLSTSLLAPGVRRVVIAPPADNSLLASGELLSLPFTVRAGATATSHLITITNVVMSSPTAGNIVPGSVGTGLISDPADTTSDQDHDGMPDSWEIQYGLNPFDPTDATADADGDGGTNLQEYQQGTDPTRAVTLLSRLYLSNHASGSTGDTSRVIAIDPASGEQIASIPMAGDPEGLAAHPDGTTVYAAVGTDLSVIDVHSNTEVDHLSEVAGSDNTVRLLEDIAIAPNGDRLYMAYRRMPYATLRIRIFDTTTPEDPTVAGTIDDSAFDGCYGPLGLAVRPDGGALYLACRPARPGRPDRFYVVDTRSDSVALAATFPRDRTNYTFINAITVNQEGTQVYLARTDNRGSTVEVFDGATGAHVTSIPLPGKSLPRSGIVSSDGDTLYVADQRLGVHVIDTGTDKLLTTMSRSRSRGMDIAAGTAGQLYVSSLFRVFALDPGANTWSGTITGDFGHAFQITSTQGR